MPLFQSGGMEMEMKKRYWKQMMSAALATCMAFSLTACGGPKVELNDGTFKPMEESELQFPQPDGTTLTGMISYPANTERNLTTVPFSKDWRRRPICTWNGMPSRGISGERKSRPLWQTPSL